MCSLQSTTTSVIYKAMKLVDLSHTLNPDMSIYPGDPAFCCSPFLTIPKDGWSVHSLSLGSHTGTHIDAPYHVIEDGKRVNELPLEWLVGEALIIDVSDHVQERGKVEWEELRTFESRMRELGQKDGGMVLIRTGWDQYWGTPRYINHPFLSREAATKIIEAGIRVLGVDTLSPDKTGDEDLDLGVHEVVLGAGCLIAENLTNLGALCSPESTGSKWVVSLMPLKIEGSDGSPVRAYAQEMVRTLTHLVLLN